MHSFTNARQFFLAQVRFENADELELLVAVQGNVSGDKISEIVLKSLLPSRSLRYPGAMTYGAGLLRAISERMFENFRGTQVGFSLMPEIEFWHIKDRW